MLFSNYQLSAFLSSINYLSY